MDSLRGAHTACIGTVRVASEELGLEALTASTGMRVAYMQALGEGLTVTELADTSARDEVKALTKEVMNLLGGKS